MPILALLHSNRSCVVGIHDTCKCIYGHCYNFLVIKCFCPQTLKFRHKSLFLAGEYFFLHIDKSYEDSKTLQYPYSARDYAILMFLVLCTKVCTLTTHIV